MDAWRRGTLALEPRQECTRLGWRQHAADVLGGDQGATVGVEGAALGERAATPQLGDAGAHAGRDRAVRLDDGDPEQGNVTLVHQPPHGRNLRAAGP